MSHRILSEQQPWKDLSDKEKYIHINFPYRKHENSYYCPLHGEVYYGEHNCPKCKEIEEKYNL